jgi:hypothetical protein
MAFLVLIIVAYLANICDKLQGYADRIIKGIFHFDGTPGFPDWVYLVD